MWLSGQLLAFADSQKFLVDPDADIFKADLCNSIPLSVLHFISHVVVIPIAIVGFCIHFGIAAVSECG
jgi:hypothetical protein